MASEVTVAVTPWAIDQAASVQSGMGLGRVGAGVGFGPLLGFWSIGGFGGLVGRTVHEPLQRLFVEEPPPAWYPPPPEPEPLTL